MVVVSEGEFEWRSCLIDGICTFWLCVLNSPPSSPSFGLCGLVLMIGPLVGSSVSLVIIIILHPVAALFHWLLVSVRHLAFPQVGWGSLLWFCRHTWCGGRLNEVWSGGTW